jgi:hypothetical protein
MRGTSHLAVIEEDAEMRNGAPGCAWRARLAAAASVASALAAASLKIFPAASHIALAVGPYMGGGLITDRSYTPLLRFGVIAVSAC